MDLVWGFLTTLLKTKRKLVTLVLFKTQFPVVPQQLLKAEAHSWSLAELIHAVVLLTHYHSLASFTFGCGITPELHCDGGHTFRPPSLSQYCVCDIANGNGHANHHDDLLGNQVSGQWRRSICVSPPHVHLHSSV